MRVFGIICEYNPFHRGHKWQIDELRRLAGEEECAVVCAMSGDFVQRGDFAIERAHARAEAAVRGGADLVLELPLPWAISSAEGFARGGVGILAATGVVDTLAFGSECGNAAKLQRAAKALLRADFPDALREELFSMGLWLTLALILGGNVIFWLDDKLLERAVPRIAALCARWTRKHP